MKKLISLIVCICMLSAAFCATAAEVYIELEPLMYDEYMRGETIFVSGTTNVYVTLGLYYPEEAGGNAKFIMTYSPSELRDGIELETSLEPREWPDGLWKITVQSSGVAETLEFTISETVDRTEEPSDDDIGDDTGDDTGNTNTPDKPNKPSGNGTTQVTLITPEKTKLTLAAGESEKISIDTTVSSLSLEIDDEKVIDASLSGKTLTVTALKVGTGTIWVKSSNNYASIKVTVTPAVEIPTEEPTEKETAPAEEPTEEKSEEATEPVNPFTDLSDNHWAKESILTLYTKGIVNGMDKDTFAPESPVTRAQFVTMLTKAFKLEMTTDATAFNDVKKSDWFYLSVMAAFENGITNGDDGGNFNPNSLITRQDMATLAYRAAKASGISFNTENPTHFADHEMIKDYAAEAVYAMRSASVINGMTEETFEPLGNATRAQAAHIIAKLIALN